MSDYEDDFEEGNDTFKNRNTKNKSKNITKIDPKKTIGRNSTGKESSYDNTFARDNTLGIKAKDYNPLKKQINGANQVQATPVASKMKDNELSAVALPKGLSKRGGIYSSTPNLQSERKGSKRSLLTGDHHISTHKKLTNFGLTKKAEQTIIPSKAMTLEQAEKLISDTKQKIEDFEGERHRADNGNLDEKLEISIKENKFLQKTLISMQEVINKVFEKYDPVKAPMKSYPQTERVKSPPRSAQMKYRTKEVENAQHALDNMMVEYQKVSARMDLIKDPNFFSNLHSQLDGINKEMKELEKENKALQTEQKKREIEMEKLLAQGAPDTMFQINDLQNKVTITKDQLRKEQAESDEVDALMQQVIEQEKVLKEKEEKLRSIGMKYEINFETQVDEKKQIEAEKLQNKKETYGKHLAIAESATKVMKKKLKTMSKVNKAKLKELEQQKQEYEKELALKSEQVKAKNREIAELMEKNADLHKVRQREPNPFTEEKIGNGYDAVQKAIQEQDEKEAKAAVILQSFCRMILAKRLVSKLREKKRNEQKLKQKELKMKDKEKEDQKGKDMEKDKKNVSTKSPEVTLKEETKKRTSVLKENPTVEAIKKKSNDAVFITKQDSVELPLQEDSDDENNKIENQKEKLKKMVAKPNIGRVKQTSKPF